MYTLSEQQIDHILNDIKLRGVEMEDLQLNLLDHICCIIESELDRGGDFQSLYEKTISKFFKKELKEIEDETILLLTFKNYYAMKKAMIISGTISVTAFIFGSLCKLMHWPGAGVMLTLGIATISLIFLPLMFLLKTRDQGPMRDKVNLGLGTLVGILFCLGTLFKVQHWPFANILIISALAVSFLLFIPIYFFTGIRKPETKVNTIVSTILMIMATGIPFMLMNVRPAQKLLQIKMYDQVLNEEFLQKLQSRSTSTDPMVAEINTQCQQIKGMILQMYLDQPSIPKDFESRDLLMEEGNLGQEFFDNGKGVQLLKTLKDEIEKVNSSLAEENKIPVEHSILSIEMDKIGRYSNYAVLSSITQLQMYLANAKMN